MKKTLLSAVFILLCYGYQVLAIQTQVNEVTDLFDKHIEDKGELLQNLKEQNDNAIEQIRSRSHHESIEGIDGAEGKVGELNSINETDLDETGRQKRSSKEYQFYDENELEPDYTKSGNRMHKLDADDIVTSTEKTMRQVGTDLMKRLIELGFNCKTVKGAVIKEPTYYIEIKREDQKNTEYDQFFCEEPRNQYNCNDNLTLTCAKTGVRYREWQDREIVLGGHMLYHNYMDWGWSVKWKRKRHGWHISGYPGSESSLSAQGITDGVRLFIANNLGVGIDQIHPTIGFPPSGRGIGNITPLYSRWRVAWDNYVFKYKYRDSYQVCEVWSEDWNERCMLK